MDIRCSVCGEPWDAWGANHGDMPAWEYDLFRKGAGCISCEGHCETDHIEDRCSDLLMNCEDPDNWHPLSIDEKPEWKKPEPKVYWECECCRVKVIEDVDNTYYDGDKKKVELKYDFSQNNSYAKRYDRNDPEKEAPYKIGGYDYCDECAEECFDCGSEVIKYSDDLDTYDEGKGFVRLGDEYYKHPDYLCIDCYEKVISNDEENE